MSRLPPLTAIRAFEAAGRHENFSRAADEPASTIAPAALAGVTACLATMGLLLTVALLATADMHPAHAYPVIAHTIVA
jgi:hypothetical protein